MTTTHKRPFWHKHIAQWQEAGVTQLAYCRQHQLCPHKFGYYKRILTNTTESQPSKPNSSGFVRVQVQPQPSSVDALTLQFANGIRLTGIVADNIALVKQLVQGLS